jgi:hypothetical protein
MTSWRLSGDFQMCPLSSSCTVLADMVTADLESEAVAIKQQALADSGRLLAGLVGKAGRPWLLAKQAEVFAADHAATAKAADEAALQEAMDRRGAPQYRNGRFRTPQPDGNPLLSDDEARRNQQLEEKRLDAASVLRARREDLDKLFRLSPSLAIDNHRQEREPAILAEVQAALSTVAVAQSLTAVLMAERVVNITHNAAPAVVGDALAWLRGPWHLEASPVLPDLPWQCRLKGSAASTMVGWLVSLTFTVRDVPDVSLRLRAAALGPAALLLAEALRMGRPADLASVSEAYIHRDRIAAAREKVGAAERLMNAYHAQLAPNQYIMAGGGDAPECNTAMVLAERAHERLLHEHEEALRLGMAGERALAAVVAVAVEKAEAQHRERLREFEALASAALSPYLAETLALGLLGSEQAVAAALAHG